MLQGRLVTKTHNVFFSLVVNIINRPSVELLVHVVEVGMLHGLLRRDPLRRLVLQHFLKKIKSISVETMDKIRHFRGIPLGVLVPVR